MELHEIRYFLALAQTLNFTRAAEQCNVSQPALTRAIRSLEEKLGGPLIHRERGNTHLTELGRIMLPYLNEAHGRMQEAKRRAAGFVHLRDARLTVGLMCTIGPTKLINLFSAFHRQYSGIELYLRDSAASELEELLIRGELDVAIYCQPGEPAEALHTLPLYAERFLIAVAPTHPLARLDEVRIADLDGRNYLSRVNCEYRDYIHDVREGQGVNIQRPYASERDDWIQCMTLAGIGFTIIPEFAVSVPGIVTRPLVDPEFVRHVKLVTVRGRPHSPAVGAFVQACRRYPWDEEMRAQPTPP